MSKSVRELLQEIQSQELLDDDFRLHVLKVVVDDNGDIEQAGNALAVTKIEIDVESKECLLHFDETATNGVSLLEAKAALVDEILDYEVCAAQEKETDEAFLRLDTPLIGFGENVELKCFFVICQA